MNYLIIGNSAAATGAIETIRKNDDQGSIAILSNETHPLYSRCLLSYYLAKSIPESALRIRPDDWHVKHNTEVIMGKQVTAVAPDSMKVTCADSSEYSYDKLLIATGGSPKIPDNIPGGIEGICVLRTIEDARKIEVKAPPNSHAVILGGGLVGMKTAFALKARGLEVTVVLRSPNVLSQMIDYDSARIVMARLEEYGITVLTGADISGIITDNGILSGVQIKSETDEIETPCNLLIVAKGVKPNTGLVETLASRQTGGSSPINICGRILKTYMPPATSLKH